MRAAGRCSAVLLVLVSATMATGCGNGAVELADELPLVSVIATTVPGAAEAAAAPKAVPTTLKYVVEPGDTLAELARRFGVTTAEIARASKLTDLNQLNVGQTLTIPVPPTTSTAAPASSVSSDTTDTTAGATERSSTTTAPATSATTSSSPAPVEGQTYIVRPGDTLARVADLFGVSAAAIAAASKLANPDRLVVGQHLTIPAE